MIFLWLLCAVLTAVTLVCLLRPLTEARSVGDGARAEVAVYRDQLAEVEADSARGLIEPADLEIARREIARRLLAANGDETAVASSSGSRHSLVSGLAAGLPLVAIGTYLWLGSPHLPAAPFARQQAPLEAAPVADLLAKVEARLAAAPGDGQGWDVVAPVYFRLQRHAEAASAYERASALLGETPQRLAGFAEATVLANNGIVVEAARLAYERLAKLQPDRIEPKFWLALALEQDGRRDAAAAAYRALLADAPADASWRPLVQERLTAVTGGTVTGNALTVPNAPALQGAGRGPSASDITAADKMSEADRGQMIRGMVDGLARRLTDNPADVEGWVRLVQSYTVLGDRERAVASLADARRKLAGNAAALETLSVLAKELGLGS